MESNHYNEKFSELYKECVLDIFKLMEENHILSIEFDGDDDIETPYAVFSDGDVFDEKVQYQSIDKIEIKYENDDFTPSEYDVISFTGGCGYTAYVDRLGGGEYIEMSALPFIYKFICEYIEKYDD